MNERERLAQLLNQKSDAFHELFGIECGAIADHLLANGVIVLPCKAGQTVYTRYGYTFEIEKVEILKDRMIFRLFFRL